MSAKKFSLTLVRHGQTAENKLKIIQGQMETQLTELGRDQAKMLAKHLSETQEKFDKVYSSDLIRAYETCQIVCDGKYDIIKCELLRERSFGVLQGSPLDLLRSEAYKAGHDETNFTQFRPKGGETMDEVQERIYSFCNEDLFRITEDSKSVLIVTHGGVIREFMKLFRRLGCAIDSKDFIITPNTGVNRFEIKVDSKGQAEQIIAKSLHKIPHLTSQAKSEALNEEQLNDSSTKKVKEVEYAI